MKFLNIAGYQFTKLSELEDLRVALLAMGNELELKGTILLSHEGININLSGFTENIDIFKNHIATTLKIKNLSFHESYSNTHSFKKFKVKLKQEIISLRQPDIDAVGHKAPNLAPEIFKQWLDEGKDLTILDTRNEYEVNFGTFKNAINLHINDFNEFPSAIDHIEKDKPIVMFCTGGIRCEKAALYMLNHGFSNVYQLEGGILGYFKKTDGEYFAGECFVFDDRIAVDVKLNQTGTLPCSVCCGPVTLTRQTEPSYSHSKTCSSCSSPLST